jgi:shikimate kinase/3-dehydroquinate synthase
MPRPAVVFIGFMGAGKSTALAAARDAGLETTEVDALLERDLGVPIAEAFERDGEEAFRAREAAVVGDLLDRADGGAIALGGGSVLSPRVREALGRHVVAWLQIDAAEAWRRIEGTGRPLARSAADVERLLAERLPLYEQLADAVVMPGGHGTPAKALPAIRVLAGTPEGTRLLWAASESGEYPVLVGEEVLDSGWWPLEGGRFCVTDANVAELYGDRLGALAATVAVEPGEGA